LAITALTKSMTNGRDASVTRFPTTRQTVEAALSERFGTPVRLAGVEAFPHFPQVSRCTLGAAGGALPRTVIVRVARDPRDSPARSGVARLLNERAALEFLGSIGSTLVPRFIAGDAAAGVLVTEDLGPHPSLLDLLLGDDREAAHQGLLAFARGLGTLHAQTVGRAAAHLELRAQLDPADSELEGLTASGRVAVSWRSVRGAVAQLGLPRPRGADHDVEEIARTLAAPGPYLALSSGDPSPVNCKIVDGAVRFFDFESAGFRHALLDATVLRYLYPTGGPPWRLPPEEAAQIEPAYRDELARACPEAGDNVAYERGMAAACAAWTILRLVRLPKVEAGPDRDSWPLLPPGWSAPVPTRSRRQQLVATVETCIASAQRAGTLENLAAWLESLVGALRARWPEAAEELPLYPVFK
jgi:hypothetical protein